MSEQQTGVKVFQGENVSEVNTEIERFLADYPDVEVISHHLQAYVHQATTWYRHRIVVSIQWRIKQSQIK